MKIFLDSSSLVSVEHWLSTGLLDGITTNPSNLSKEGGNPQEILRKVCSLMKDKDVSIEVTETEPKAVYEQAKKIAGIAQNVVVKIPCHQQYYGVIKRLGEEGIAINVTLLFTLVQALFMCKLGVKYISPFVGRWDDIDVEGADLLYELREMIDRYQYDTQILAASVRHVRHIHAAIMAGADVITVPPAVLEKATEHVLTDQGIKLFTNDWQKVGIKQFP